jgi:hypothetical protein
MIKNLLLAKKPWRILRPPDNAEFVTSDNPLVTFVSLGNGKLHPGYGFSKKETQAVFPLAPSACLSIGNSWQVQQTLRLEDLNEINEAIIRICDRYVYTKTPSEEVQKLVAVYAGTERYGVNAFVGAGLKLPEARQFLRTYFGLEMD